MKKTNEYCRYGITVVQSEIMDTYLEKICKVCSDKRKGTDYNLDECPIFRAFHFASVWAKCEPVAIHKPNTKQEAREDKSYINTEQEKLFNELRKELCEACSHVELCNNKHDCKLLSYFRV